MANLLFTDTRKEMKTMTKPHGQVVIKEPYIFKVLDISTGHITEDDAKRLEANEDRITAYSLHEYGWLVYIGEIIENWPKKYWSPAFRKVLRVAKELGCEYVRFDRDGTEYDGLPKFDW